MQFTWQCVFFRSPFGETASGQQRDIRHSCSAILHFRCFLTAMYHLSDSELVTSPAVLPVKGFNESSHDDLPRMFWSFCRIRAEMCVRVCVWDFFGLNNRKYPVKFGMNTLFFFFWIC